MKITNLHRGFTLVETLVAIGILVIAITGAFSASQSGLSSYLLSKNQIIAFNLAQESMEQIRALRDENKMNGNNWLQGFAASAGDPCYPGGSKICTTDAVTYTVISCGATGTGPCNVIRQDPATSAYGYNAAWTPTGFRREIQISAISANEISVLVTVSWSKGIVNRQFKIRENLFNW